ncbi:MAG: hypothetical protein V3U75_13200 [Methylococcaceae bacterium]
MKIISFAWTTEALRTGKKTVTRRFWSDSYAKQFKEGDLVQAYDRSPRFKGKQIAIIRLTQAPYKEPLSLMTDEEEKAEGGLWGSAEAFIEAMGGPDKVPWVIRFEPVTGQA